MPGIRLSTLQKIRAATERGLTARENLRTLENLNAARPNREMWDEYNYYKKQSPREKFYTSNEAAIKDYVGQYYDVPDESLNAICPAYDLEPWTSEEFIKYYKK